MPFIVNVHIIQNVFRGSWSAKKLNKKTIANALTIMLVLMMFSNFIILQVYAVDVKIISISPAGKTGRVGERVTLIGTINTTDGAYEVRFNNTPVAWGRASGNNVNCSFIIPPLPGGNYTVTLRDVNASVDSPRSWFYIGTAYIVKVDKPPHPNQLQEGTTAINISVSITGGRADARYTANVTVKTPANETYWSLVPINTIDTGVGNATIRYPEDFGGNDHTNYTGTYMVYFNGTLASDKFFIGLTDQTEYHRGDVVKIKAVGYMSLYGTNVTITVKLGNKLIDFLNYTILGDFIEANWIIPANALIGNYSLSITPKPNTKKVNDTQIFAVPSFKTKIVPRSLANETVAGVFIKVYDHEARETYNATSGPNGVANIWLEKGNHTFTAYFKKVKVGEASFSIPYVHDELNLTCQLTNLNITVVSEQDPTIRIPFVFLNLTATYSTELNGGKVEKESSGSQTDIDGSAKFRMLILNASYRITASRYGRIFYNETIPTLGLKAWNNREIRCPVKLLTVNVIDANNNPITDALVEIQETIGGLYNSSRTNHNGRSIFNCVFGIYTIKVSLKGIILNVTTIELFDEKMVTMQCSLYNLPIHVRVVDYLGQPIPNANVTLERNGVQISSKLTGANGLATFTEIGGTLTIKVYLAGQRQPASSVVCSIWEPRSETNPIEIKLSGYVAFAGILIETAWFTTLVLVIAAIIVFAVLEIVRRLPKK